MRGVRTICGNVKLEFEYYRGQTADDVWKIFDSARRKQDFIAEQFTGNSGDVIHVRGKALNILVGLIGVLIDEKWMLDDKDEHMIRYFIRTIQEQVEPEDELEVWLFADL